MCVNNRRSRFPTGWFRKDEEAVEVGRRSRHQPLTNRPQHRSNQDYIILREEHPLQLSRDLL